MLEGASHFTPRESMSMTKKIRILIVDDSALVRQTLTSIYSSDPEIEVIGFSGHGCPAEGVAPGTPFIHAESGRKGLLAGQCHDQHRCSNPSPHRSSS